MERIEQTIEVDRLVRTVYNQWTQFEEFPRFMDGVKEVTRMPARFASRRSAPIARRSAWFSPMSRKGPRRTSAMRSGFSAGASRKV